MELMYGICEGLPDATPLDPWKWDAGFTQVFRDKQDLLDAGFEEWYQNENYFCIDESGHFSKLVYDRVAQRFTVERDSTKSTDKVLFLNILKRTIENRRDMIATSGMGQIRGRPSLMLRIFREWIGSFFIKRGGIDQAEWCKALELVADGKPEALDELRNYSWLFT